ncbi:hypothetical protein [Streptomyces indicus]|uniref:Phage minor capsid protein 2 n=1 Tax=Streptomyces indicus TaxID=417292 RepID=A0A1G8W8P0_9ACTN|nr:hypothetical protein [Streptomyces indicus]SDJ74642.1 hypothetical protein SAMN05421806_102307 [Streptomyces indicus]
MATINSARQLADEHRRAQTAVASRTAAQVLDGWHRLVQPRRLEESAPRWLDVSLDVVSVERTQSRELAASYLRLHRALSTDTTLPPYDEHPADDVITLGELRQDFADLAETELGRARDDGVVVVIEDDYTWPEPDTDGHNAAARTSLIVTGPTHARQRLTEAERSVDSGRLDDADFLEELDALMRDAGATAAGAADREVLRGGRDLLHTASATDPRVIGWARVTDTDPCAWCAMLASRGAVYRTRDAGQLRGRAGQTPPAVDPEDLAKYHDLCHCQVLPIYSRTDWLPEQGRAFRELWDEATQGHTGQDAINAYRRAIEARRRRARTRGAPLA